MIKNSEISKVWQQQSPRVRLIIKVCFCLFIFLSLIYLFVFAGLPTAKEIKNFKLSSTVTPGQIEWSKRKTRPIRIWVPLAHISPYLQRAAIISEDDVFYHHNGINYEKMKEAFRINLKKRRYVRGASTITMQLARNAFLHKRKTLIRKIREIILAHRLEKYLSKNQILELYLNIIEMGEGIYGAEAAARFYFGKSAARLDLNEATLLAAILPNPKYFNPYVRMQSCLRMQKRVLRLMQLEGSITELQAQSVKLNPPLIQNTIVKPTPQSAVVDAAEEAKYLDSLPKSIEIQPRKIKFLTPDSLPVPDTLAVP